MTLETPQDHGASPQYPGKLGWRLRRIGFQFALRGHAIDFTTFFQNDTVALFPGLGVILNRVKKSGNSSVVAFLDDLERHAQGQTTAPTSLESVKSARRPHLASPGCVWRAGRFATLVTVRNPYTRAVSGYLDKIAHGTNPRYANYPGFGQTSPAAFETFLAAARDRRFFSNRHFYPQTALLFQPAERFTKVARLETLAVDMAAFLARIGHDPAPAARLDRPHALEARVPGKIQNSAAHPHYLTPTARALIASLYDADFATFGYDRNKMP